MIDRLRRDPYIGFVAATCVIVVAALVAIGLAWESLADSDVVSTQLAYAASGALGGVALLGFALGVAAVQATRRAEARERAEIDRVVTAAADLLATLRQEPSR